METAVQRTYRYGRGSVLIWPDVRLALEALGASFIFLFLVTKIPGLILQSEFGDYFLPLVVAVFVASVLIAVLAPFDWMLGLILIGSIVVPLSEVPATGAYNVATSGLLFGALFRIRPNQMRLNRDHAKLFTALFVLGLYYNAIPLLFDDGSGFHPRLWFFNFSTFVTYIFVGLLVTHSRTPLPWGQLARSCGR